MFASDENSGSLVQIITLPAFIFLLGVTVYAGNSLLVKMYAFSDTLTMF